jgi:phosphonate ABC transporter permease subunit PhnE
MKKKPSFSRSLITGFGVVVCILILAYGFQVTEVNFKETRSEIRLTQLTRIIRALAHPDIIEYNQDEVFIETPVYVPCPEGEVTIPEPPKSGPYIVLDPYCAGPGEFIVVKGYNFNPDSKGPINFIPPSGASLTIGNYTTDSEGNFEQRVALPKRQPVVEAQTIRTIERTNVGYPHLSPVTIATWDKIVETVFLALLATTFGTLLAIPVSFFAARNLMSDIKTPLTSIALSLIGWPLGIAIGILVASWIAQLSDMLTTNVGLNIGGVILSPVAGWFLARWAIPAEDSKTSSTLARIVRLLALIGAAAFVIFAAYLLGRLMFVSGQALIGVLGPFGFLGYFIEQTGEIIRMITPATVALASGAALGSSLSKFGLVTSERLPTSSVRIFNFILAALAGATLFAIVGGGINWLYQIGNPVETLWIPAGVGALLGILVALRYGPEALLPVGSTIYFIMRTILNAIRSIEPLIYVIVFVVWVGIGPFAGALALALHTIAALAKLYSEQVESILPGPLEAVTATGATRLQMIVYAVVPQIIPPYISFTMYRWDINVRMSTIIGFAGGGGIGFLLQQNIRLLDYRAASVQMLAIAIVVASMDYTSALIRERFV